MKKKITEREKRRMKQNIKRLSFKLIRRSLDYNPERANLSGIARNIDSTVAKLWFYCRGYAKFPADDFIRMMAALGHLKTTKDGLSLHLPVTHEEGQELLDISRKKTPPTKSSSIAGAGTFKRVDDPGVHPELA